MMGTVLNKCQNNYPITHLCTSTPVTSTGSVLQPATPQSQENTTLRSRPSVENSIVRAGLIPQHLVDIFLTPHADNSTEKHPSRRITEVRVLPTNENVEMMREKDKKEKEAAEEREQKRAEKKQREKKRMEREGKRKQSEGNQTRGKGKCARQNEEEAFEDEIYCRSSSLTHSTRAPERFRDDTPTGSEERTQCVFCAMRGSPQLLLI